MFESRKPNAYILRVLCGLVIGAISPPIFAADVGAFELTPFGAFTFGGTFSDTDSDLSAGLEDAENFGLILDFRDGANTQWEILYSMQSTTAEFSDPQFADVDVDVHYLQGGGTYQGDGDKVRPYLAATIGGTYFDVKGNGYESDTFFSFSLGPGLQIRPSDRLGLRLEARVFGTLVRSNSDLFCVSDPANESAGCAITVSGEILWQTQLMAGVVFRF